MADYYYDIKNINGYGAIHQTSGKVKAIASSSWCDSKRSAQDQADFRAKKALNSEYAVSEDTSGQLITNVIGGVNWVGLKHERYKGEIKIENRSWAVNDGGTTHKCTTTVSRTDEAFRKGYYVILPLDFSQIHSGINNIKLHLNVNGVIGGNENENYAIIFPNSVDCPSEWIEVNNDDIIKQFVKINTSGNIELELDKQKFETCRNYIKNNMSWIAIHPYNTTTEKKFFKLQSAYITYESNVFVDGRKDNIIWSTDENIKLKFDNAYINKYTRILYQNEIIAYGKCDENGILINSNLPEQNTSREYQVNIYRNGDFSEIIEEFKIEIKRNKKPQLLNITKANNAVIVKNDNYNFYTQPNNNSFPLANIDIEESNINISQYATKAVQWYWSEDNINWIKGPSTRIFVDNTDIYYCIKDSTGEYSESIKVNLLPHPVPTCNISVDESYNYKYKDQEYLPQLKLEFTNTFISGRLVITIEDKNFGIYTIGKILSNMNESLTVDYNQFREERDTKGYQYNSKITVFYEDGGWQNQCLKDKISIGPIAISPNEVVEYEALKEHYFYNTIKIKLEDNEPLQNENIGNIEIVNCNTNEIVNNIKILNQNIHIIGSNKYIEINDDILLNLPPDINYQFGITLKNIHGYEKFYIFQAIKFKLISNLPNLSMIFKDIIINDDEVEETIIYNNINDYIYDIYNKNKKTVEIIFQNLEADYKYLNIKYYINNNKSYELKNILLTDYISPLIIGIDDTACDYRLSRLELAKLIADKDSDKRIDNYPFYAKFTLQDIYSNNYELGNYQMGIINYNRIPEILDFGIYGIYTQNGEKINYQFKDNQTSYLRENQKLCWIAHAKIYTEGKYDSQLSRIAGDFQISDWLNTGIKKGNDNIPDETWGINQNYNYTINFEDEGTSALKGQDITIFSYIKEKDYYYTVPEINDNNQRQYSINIYNVNGEYRDQLENINTITYNLLYHYPDNLQIERLSVDTSKSTDVTKYYTFNASYNQNALLTIENKIFSSPILSTIRNIQTYINNNLQNSTIEGENLICNDSDELQEVNLQNLTAITSFPMGSEDIGYFYIENQPDYITAFVRFNYQTIYNTKILVSKIVPKNSENLSEISDIYLNISTTKESSNTKNFLCILKLPTIAYRPNQILINCIDDEQNKYSKAICGITAYNNRNQIILSQSMDSSDDLVISLDNNTINYQNRKINFIGVNDQNGLDGGQISNFIIDGGSW